MADPPADRRRPGLAVLAVFLTVETVLVGLGAWQLERRAWKHDLIARIGNRLALPPLALTGAVGDMAALEHRRVMVSGRLLSGHEIYLSGRSRRGRPGVQVITPLLRDGMPAVLINRGWIPFGGAHRERRLPTRGRWVTVTGIARTASKPGPFTPANDPAKGFWITYDPGPMGKALGVGTPLPLVIEARAASDSAILLNGGVTRVPIADNHLGYALTWFALGAALAGVFAVFHRNRRDDT